MTAEEMRKISGDYTLRQDAVDYGIKTIEEKMMEYTKGFFANVMFHLTITPVLLRDLKKNTAITRNIANST